MGSPCWARGQHIWYNQYLPYFLRQALKMNLRLTNSGRLVGQPSQGFSCLCLPKCWDDRYAPPTPLKWVVGIWTHSGHPICKPHTLLTDLPPPDPVWDRVSCSPGWAQTQSIWSRQWFWAWDLPSSTSSNAGIIQDYTPHVLLFWLKFLFFDNLFMCFNHIHPIIFISLPMNLLFPITSLLSCMHVTHWV